MVRFFLLLLALVCLPSSVWAMQANGCDDYQEPAINVQQLVAQPRYNDTLDLPAIRKLASEGGQAISSSRHETPVGLTASSLKLDSRFEINVKHTAHDVMVCAQISSFSLSFGFDDTTVYLARELPYGSCSYHTVLDHEMKHVQTDQYLVRYYATQFPQLLRDAVREVGVIRASSSEAADNQIRAIISKYMSGLGTSLSDVRRKYQAKIDTPEEYERLSKSCNYALSDLIKQSGQGRSY